MIEYIKPIQKEEVIFHAKKLYAINKYLPIFTSSTTNRYTRFEINHYCVSDIKLGIRGGIIETDCISYLSDDLAIGNYVMYPKEFIDYCNKIGYPYTEDVFAYIRDLEINSLKTTARKLGIRKKLIHNDDEFPDDIYFEVEIKSYFLEKEFLFFHNLKNRIISFCRDRGQSHKDWAFLVKQRDGKCVNCGSKENLHAHHIDQYSNGIKNRYDLNNGITLCKKCHIEHHNS